MAISQVKISAHMGESFKTDINCSQTFIIDQPKPMGGGEGPNPIELLLSSLAGCLCAIGRIVASQRKLDVKGIDVNVEADMDKDFLLGMTQEGRAGFTAINVMVDIDAPNMSQAEKQEYLEEIERRCPIADNIMNTSSITTTLK